jgi:hypothetical protein
MSSGSLTHSSLALPSLGVLGWGRSPPLRWPQAWVGVGLRPGSVSHGFCSTPEFFLFVPKVFWYCPCQVAGEIFSAQEAPALGHGGWRWSHMPASRSPAAKLSLSSPGPAFSSADLFWGEEEVRCPGYLLSGKCYLLVRKIGE